jgi:hypothetical protein
MPNSQGYTISQSAWALDAVEEFTTAPIYTSADVNEAYPGPTYGMSGAAGELQNDYSQCFGSSLFESSWALSCSVDHVEDVPVSLDAIPLRFGARLVGYAAHDPRWKTYPRTFAEHAVGNAAPAGVPNSYSISAWVYPQGRDSTSPLPGLINNKPFNIVSFQSADHPASSSVGLTSATCSVRFFLTGGNPYDAGPLREYYVASETVLKNGSSYIVDFASSSIKIDQNEWSHVLVCYDATTPDLESSPSDRIKIYINGELSLGTSSVSPNQGTPMLALINPSTGAIGNSAGSDLKFNTLTGSQIANPNYFINNVFQGGISELSIFNYSLYSFSEDLPALMYNGGCPPDMTKLPVFYNLDQRPVGYYRLGAITCSAPVPGTEFAAGHGPGDSPGSASWDQSMPGNCSVARAVNAVGWEWNEPYYGDQFFYATGDGYPVLPISQSVGVLQTYLDYKNEGPSSHVASPCPSGSTNPNKWDLIASPIYNRKHSLGSVFSTTHFGWAPPKSSYSASQDYDSRTLSMPIPETSASIAAWRNQYPQNPIPKIKELPVYKTPLGAIQTCGGSAEWESDRLAGHLSNGIWVSSSQSPSYNTYQEYNQNMRLTNQDYSIIPEFIISDEVDFYLNKQKGNSLSPNPSQFKIKGTSTGSSNVPTNSSENGFYEVFSNSDFLRHFSVIKQDHKGFASPSTIAMKCKALMKFLPYDGFFPSERSLQIANQFSKSYGSYVEYSGLDKNLKKSKFRPFLTPFFRPGIVYNTIKSGIAVDFPIYTSSYQVINYKSFYSTHAPIRSYYSDYYALGTQKIYSDPNTQYSASWDFRVPFEAVVEPEKYISGMKIYDLEPHPSSAIDVQAMWSGQGDDLYKKMMHNYLAAIPEFFLPNGEFTNLKSKSESEFATVQSGSSYGMRIKIKRTMNKKRSWRTYAHNESTITYEVPQDPRVLHGETENLRETFTMYSRPSAFGPPVAATSYLGFKRAPVAGALASVYPNNLVNVDYNTDLYPSDSLMGINPSYTPPYYGRESWADIVYKATESGKITLDEIFSRATVNLWGIDTDPILNGVTSSVTGTLYGNSRQQAIWSSNENSVTNDYSSPMRTSYANSNAMQINSSFNLFGKVGDRWVVEPKFETPHYNFNSETSIRPITSASNSLTIPTNGSESVPRGMWHQFGTLETDKGIYMEIDSIPEEWRKVRGYADPYRSSFKTEILSNIDLSVYQNEKFEDLSKLVGFETSKKLGNTAKSLTVSEAVVAVPFIIKDGKKQFFQIPEDVIRRALGDLNTISSNQSINQSSLAIKSAISGLDNNKDLFDNKQDLRAAKVRAAAAAAGTASANQLDRDEKTSEKVSDTIKDMVSKMKKFVFPPNMDFVQNLGKVTPFAMYIFEFDYTFTQDDLVYMWQNISPPKRKAKFINKEVEISHKLLANELMGSFGQETEDPIKDGLQWMVFKVKQRAGNNYFSKVSKESGPKTQQFPFSYNWPYDFFSLVEFVNIDTKIGFGEGLQSDDLDQEVAKVSEDPLRVGKGRTKSKRKKAGKRKK